MESPSPPPWTKEDITIVVSFAYIFSKLFYIKIFKLTEKDTHIYHQPASTTVNIFAIFASSVYNILHQIEGDIDYKILHYFIKKK